MVAGFTDGLRIEARHRWFHGAVDFSVLFPKPEAPQGVSGSFFLQQASVCP
jgi:hypothetical protein